MSCGITVQGSRLSNARVKPKGDVCKAATDAGAAGLAFVRVAAGGELEGAKALREALAEGSRKDDLLAACQAGEGDLLLLAAGKPAVVNKCAFLTANVPCAMCGT